MFLAAEGMHALAHSLQKNPRELPLIYAPHMASPEIKMLVVRATPHADLDPQLPARLAADALGL